MNNRKNYNSIVFLAAFFGLVLVGATPQVSAQDSSSTGKTIRAAIVSNYVTIHLDFDWVINLEKTLVENPKSAFTYMKADFGISEYKVFDWKIQNAEGNPSAINFLKKEVFCNNCYLNNQFFSKKLSHEIEITQNEIRTVSRITFSDAKEAKYFQSGYNQTSSSADLYYKDDEDKIILLYLNNTNARAENNQVFIVTRLPRASIDELLAEKNAR
ncbi:MAG: hypothetical protein JWN60_3274 [Acidobacteria bacterium]|nr:hypothetical protein [Acidobacteriota bacterium]